MVDFPPSLTGRKEKGGVEKAEIMPRVGKAVTAPRSLPACLVALIIVTTTLFTIYGTIFLAAVTAKQLVDTLWLALGLVPPL